MRATARYWLSPTTRCCEGASWLRCKCPISLRNPTAPRRCWWAAPRPTPKAGGETVYLARDSMALVREWRERSGVCEGRLFRSLNRGALGERLDASQVPRIFKAMAERAGLPGEVVSGISGHSTRVGAAQDMVAGGIAMAAILHAGRWKTTAMVNRYGERLLARRSARRNSPVFSIARRRAVVYYRGALAYYSAYPRHPPAPSKRQEPCQGAVFHRKLSRAKSAARRSAGVRAPGARTTRDRRRGGRNRHGIIGLNIGATGPTIAESRPGSLRGAGRKRRI